MVKSYKKIVMMIVMVSGSLLASCQPSPTQGEQFCIKLIVSKRPLDFESPWLTLNENVENYYATLVAKNRVVTTADAVRDHALIEAQVFGSTSKTPVTVEWVDYEANLASIVLPDSFNKNRLVPISLFDETPRLPKLIKAKNIQETTEVFLTFLKAEVKQTDISQLSYTHLIFETAQKGHGTAEPIVEDGQLVGIAVSQNDSAVTAIPSSIISHFLEDDFTKEKYRGFGKLGVFGMSLSDPLKLQQLGLPEDTSGNLVTRVLANSSADGFLKENDIITEIAGKEVNKDGQVKDSRWGRLHFSAVLEQYYGGDKVEVSILRDKKSMEIEIPLKQFSSNQGIFHVVDSTGETNYRILGGLVLQELSLGFLKTFGDRWGNVAPLNLLYLYGNNLEFGYTSKRRIFLNKVFADAGNRGYEEIKYQLIKSVNNQPVSTLADIDIAIKNPKILDGKPYLTFEMDDGSGQIVIDHAKLAEIDERIRKNYNLP